MSDDGDQSSLDPSEEDAGGSATRTEPGTPQTTRSAARLPDGRPTGTPSKPLGDPETAGAGRSAALRDELTAWLPLVLKIVVSLATLTYLAGIGVRAWCWLWATNDVATGARPPTWAEFATILSHVAWPITALVGLVLAQPILTRLVADLERRNTYKIWDALEAGEFNQPQIDTAPGLKRAPEDQHA